MKNCWFLGLCSWRNLLKDNGCLIVWSIFKGRKRSTYGVMGMIGKVVEIRRWNKTEGQVFINGELWSAACEIPLPVDGKAVVQGIEGVTLRLKPYENSWRRLF